MLKRIGVGAFLLVLSMCCIFAINETVLINIFSINFSNASQYITLIACIVQQCLYALSAMFLYPALYEFICAQSPHSRFVEEYYSKIQEEY